MKVRTINLVISNKIKAWTRSFDDETIIKKITAGDTILDNRVDQQATSFTDLIANVRGWNDLKPVERFQQLVHESVIVTGGCIASMLLKEEVNDYDVYFADKKAAELVALYYIEKMAIKASQNWRIPRVDVVDNNTDGISIFIKSAGIAGEDIDLNSYGYFEMMELNALDEFLDEYKKVRDKEDKYAVKLMTSNAITLNQDIQIILRFCGNPEQIHTWYDFVHATNYWTKATGVVFREKALLALFERELYYIGSKFPLASLFRLRKFIQRGFKITAGEITKIAYDVSKLDMNDARVLHDQLIGVDYAYFSEVIGILRQNNGKELDRSYLFEILNNVFGMDDDHHPIEADEPVGRANT